MKNFSRRSFLGGLSLGAAALASPISLSGCGPAGSNGEDDGRLGGPLSGGKRPNLLIIHTDQQDSWTLGTYGGKLAKTPHIDALAAQGVVLDGFFTNGATCTPSRGCLMSGMYPHQHGAYRNSAPIKSRAEGVVTFAHSLADAGYRTGYIGKWHLAGPATPGWRPQDPMGFADETNMYNSGHYKEFIDQPHGKPPKVSYKIGDHRTYSTDWMAQKTIEFLRANKDEPFCCMVAIPDPHDPYEVRAPYSKRFSPRDMPVPDTFTPSDMIASAHALQAIKAQYCGMVECIDDRVGAILAELDTLGLTDDTIVVFMTDHGDYMGEHGRMGKDYYYEEALHIPCIVRYPGHIPAGSRVSRLISMVDLGPTLLALMGVPDHGSPSGHDASSLLLREPGATWVDEVHVHRYQQIFKDEGKGVDTLNPFACMFTPDYELVVQAVDAPLLYLRSDYPDQLVNLWGDAGYAKVRSDLAKRMLAQHQAVSSPQLTWLTPQLQGV